MSKLQTSLVSGMEYECINNPRAHFVLRGILASKLYRFAIKSDTSMIQIVRDSLKNHLSVSKQKGGE